MGIINKTRKTFAVAALTAAVAAGIQGCSADDPDTGSSGLANNVSGIAVDGYLFGARVYVDLNNNAQRDAGEPAAITDRDGYFTTGKDGTDYCAVTASQEEAKHCLRAVYSDGTIVIRTEGGFDLFTGEPFLGALSTDVDVTAGEPIQNKMVSPITTVLTGLTDLEKQTILGNLGLQAEDVERDFLNFDDPLNFDADTANAALALHKAVTIIGDRLEETYDEIGEDGALPTSTNNLIYSGLADLLANSNAGSIIGVLNNDVLGDVLLAAEADLREMYTEEELTLPPLVSGDSAFSLFEVASAESNAENIITLVDDLVIGAAATENDIVSRALAIELVTAKIVNDAGSTEITNTINEAENPASGLYTGLLDLSEEVDFVGLLDTAISPTTNYAGLDISGAEQFIDEVAEEGLANKQISASYNDAGVSGDVVFFFNADEELATEGTLNVCIRYIDDNDELEEETNGALIEGEWSAITDKRLLVTLGGGYDVTVVSKGSNTYSLYYAGDTVDWDSVNGIIADDDPNAMEEPADDAACEAMFQQS